MTMTTEQWEALLVPKMPDELWVESSDWDGEGWDVCFRHPKWDVPASLGLAYRKDVADLFAASPKTVAELVRLRRALEDLRDTYAAPDDPGDDYGRGMEAAYQIAADALTRILEGGTE